MDATVTLLEDMHFVGEGGSGVPVHLDSDPAAGGAGQGARPLELLAIGLAGCTAMDVVSILRKKRQDIRGLEVKVHAGRAVDYPKVFTDITLSYVVTGHDVDPVAVERAIQLSQERYCPAYAMLSQAAPITSGYEIIPA